MQLRCSSGLAGRQSSSEGEGEENATVMRPEFELVFDKEARPFTHTELPMVIRAELTGDFSSWEPTHHKVRVYSRIIAQHGYLHGNSASAKK